ncbi:metal ABC transporter ATP-binding protein [Pseudotabrizicola algicola]|uniref:Metal ABC transporter ATP-binding protein n=1 Tax=Pseudotabrizicola algicola TaxID=2709381 RepID=A0A6B3RWG2_9RHOB|nr:metal ABC transporter ATP-binding protein [Pseudotabrizicola algicola]NEX47359.1 metal ABC transporter ATP-binding protein [Pseudotabrizicola algicola]
MADRVPPNPLRAAECPALEVRGLSLRYKDVQALEAVTATVPAGSMTAIIGPNGAGKSTLLKSVLGLVQAEGEVRAFGGPVAQAMARIAYVPQRAAVDWAFPVRVIDVVLMGCYRQTGLLGRIDAQVMAQAQSALARVGLQDFARRQIGALSGGQQQRVFLARALAQGADLFLLDEPFAGVDAATESAIIGVLKSLRASGATILAVHHDLTTVASYFDRVLLLNRRSIAEGPVAQTFTRAALEKAYGPALFPDPAIRSAS